MTKEKEKIRKEVLDELLAKYKTPEDLLGKEGIIKQLTQALVQRALEGELTDHLGYEKYDPQGNNSGNSRNGASGKKVKTGNGEIEIEVPRDRNGEFEPQLIKKHQRRFNGFDGKIISMYARGMTVRDIQDHLEEQYGVDVSPTLISNVTESIMEEVTAWQNRPLDSVYPILYLDAVRIKAGDDGHIVNKAVYLALGINMEGHKDILGMWIAREEGAKFWLKIVTELHNRGIQDIFIACVDGLKGFPEAINSVFPEAEVQLCILHMVRQSLRFVPFKDRKELARDLKAIYSAKTVDEAANNLVLFRKKWDNKYPTIGDIWERNWEGIIPFMAYPDYIRKVIYTTNAIESLNSGLRKISRNRGLFPNDESVMKLLYLALKNMKKKWSMPIREWKQALNQFAVIFGNRFPQTL